MFLSELHSKVRSHGRDFNKTIFRAEDITMFLNEGIDRFAQVMPMLTNVPYLYADDDEVEMIPKEYVHLLANYAIARLMMQDERHYEATTFMNEFELKLGEFKEKVENGEAKLIDPITGEQLDTSLDVDYVTNQYYRRNRTEGV